MRIRNLGSASVVGDEPHASLAAGVSPKLSRRRAYRAYLEDLAHELSCCESFTTTELPKWEEELNRLAELPSPGREQEFVESIVAELSPEHECASVSADEAYSGKAKADEEGTGENADRKLDAAFQAVGGSRSRSH